MTGTIVVPDKIRRIDDALAGVVDPEEQQATEEMKQAILDCFRSESQRLAYIQMISQLHLRLPEVPSRLAKRAFYSLLVRGQLTYAGHVTVGRNKVPAYQIPSPKPTS